MAPENSPPESPAERIVVTHTARGAAQMLAKRVVQTAFGLWVLPRLALYRLSRTLGGDRAFLGASEAMSRGAGQWGVYCRQAFYRRTLARCGRDVYIGWHSVFSMPQAEVGENVYIGRRCGIGYATIGANVMLADGVQILSGGREHGRGGGADGTHQDQAQEYRRLSIGAGAWLGTNAVIMADVGEHAIVGAGAVVTRPVPAQSVAVGVPARVVKRVEAG